MSLLPRPRFRARALLPAALLGLTIVLAGALAYEAYRAARSHRLTAERLLRDYASFAAFELLASAEKSLEGTLAAALAPVTGIAGSPYDPLLSPAVLAATADSVLRCPTTAADSVRRYFRVDFGSSAIVTVPPGEGGRGKREAWVRDTVLAHYRKQHQPGSGFGMIVRDDVAVAYGIKYAPHRAPLAAYGIVTCGDALAAPLFQRALARGPLLPAAVTEGVPGDSLLSIQVTDASGHTVFTLGPQESAPFAAVVGAPRLGGFQARAALVPAAVERLAVAQPPSPRLPFLVGLLALTVALATVAFVQLRREQELAQLRSDFVSNVSHELRTPLAQILLFGETLALDRARGDNDRRVAAKTIVEETRRLIMMVENLLQLSRARQATVRPVERVPTRVSALLRSVASSFRPLASQSSVSLEEAVEDEVVALADAASVRQIVLNLLDNAVKYGPSGQTITLRCAHGDKNGASVRICVEDQGPGVAPEDRERIFERFARGDRSGTQGGTGLGLAVARELAEQQGGKVWVEPGDSGGARFVVELPA